MKKITTGTIIMLGICLFDMQGNSSGTPNPRARGVPVESQDDSTAGVSQFDEERKVDLTTSQEFALPPTTQQPSYQFQKRYDDSGFKLPPKKWRYVTETGG
ncbi:MAG: hypothetical protein LBF72_01500 [Holosporales bacterium]|jgi:hypothetical protein|nr:hypothetical protein [Holosporales bacterium]